MTVIRICSHYQMLVTPTFREDLAAPGYCHGCSDRRDVVPGPTRTVAKAHESRPGPRLLLCSSCYRSMKEGPQDGALALTVHRLDQR